MGRGRAAGGGGGKAVFSYGRAVAKIVCLFPLLGGMG